MSVKLNMLILLVRRSQQSISAIGVDLSLIPSVSLCVCLSVCKVYCGKTADWIQMPFGVVSGVGRGMPIRWGGGRRRERAVLGEFGASHCNQWGLCCVVV